REVRKLLRRGVQVFSRGSLHAKFFVIDRAVIAGSSNISKHAKESLDEAAILTDDVSTVARAVETFERLCTEPVRKDYLETCIAAYRPPRFPEGRPRAKRRGHLAPAKLWIIGGLENKEVPEAERATVSKVTKRAERNLRDFERSAVDSIHY